jgi:hypothetical protein
MTVVTLAYVIRFGPSVPLWDDYVVIEVVTGGRPLSFEWLWALHNEHRVPLPKLLLVGLYRITGNEFRSGMFCNVAMLSALAAACLVVAGRRPGGARTYDLAFPLWMLNLSHFDNLLWSWELVFVVSPAISGALILLIASRPGWLGRGATIGAGAGLAALCLCGACGVALVPALAGWMLVAAVARKSIASMAAAFVGLGLTAAYFVGYHPASHHRPAPNVSAALSTSLQFLSLMFGTEGRDLWPVSGLAALALVGLSVALVARIVLFGPAEERPRALGLLAAFAALGSLVLALGWGRAGSGEFAGFEPRYITLICPIWIAVFFAWDRHTPSALRTVVLTAIVAVELIFLWPITLKALEVGRSRVGETERFVRAVHAGVPIYRLVRNFTPLLHPSQDELARQFALLRRARVGLFAELADNPAFREVRVAVDPAEVVLGSWKSGSFHGTGIDPYLRYVLPRAEKVAGVRLAYSHVNPAGTPGRFRFLWASAPDTGPAPGQAFANWALPTGSDRETVIWIDDTIQEFWIQPDNQPCDFAVRRLTLLIDPNPLRARNR